MIPGFLVLNTVTTMSVSAQFGKPYSAAIFGFTGLITTIIVVKTYEGLLDWFEKFYFIMSSGVAAAYATKSGKRAGRYFKKIRNFNKNQDVVKFTLVSLFRIKSA
jgi:hypothetical protein